MRYYQWTNGDRHNYGNELRQHNGRTFMYTSPATAIASETCRRRPPPQNTEKGASLRNRNGRQAYRLNPYVEGRKKLLRLPAAYAERGP